MRQIGSVVYWFCAGAALLLALFGAWNFLIGKQGQPNSILLFCLGVAAAFYLAGVWTHGMTRRAARNA